MKSLLKVFFPVIVAFFLLSGTSILFGADDFSPYLKQISAQTSASKDNFAAELSAEFGVPIPKINEMRAKFGMNNGDIYFALELGKQTKKPVDEIIDQYQKNRSRGWGYIAREMGIKPGSPAFKALKAKAQKKARNKKRIKDENKWNKKTNGMNKGGSGSGKGKKR